MNYLTLLGFCKKLFTVCVGRFIKYISPIIELVGYATDLSAYRYTVNYLFFYHLVPDENTLLGFCGFSYL